MGEPTALGFAAARFRHFAAVIRGSGHEVCEVDASRPAAEQADVVVSAGIYRPTEVAVRIAGDRPLWIDLPGDPFADAQAVVARGGDPVAVADAWRLFEADRTRQPLSLATHHSRLVIGPESAAPAVPPCPSRFQP